MCGIGGIISSKYRPFDYRAFTALGIVNDSRGGDSCGVFIDGKYYYGVKEKKYFADAFKDIDIINNTTESQIALVHCRKASVGAIDVSTAQPVIIAPDNKVEFVLLHNGTIYNYQKLAMKYIPDIDIKGMTDSQVMAQIIYYSGYDVLEEYIGAAAFVIADYRGKEPVTLFYHGKSKYCDYSTSEQEERPLYFVLDQEKETLYFSSIYTILESFDKDYVAYAVPYNKLCMFYGDGLRLVRKIDRSKCFQKEKTVYNNNNYTYSVYSYSSFSDFVTCDPNCNKYRTGNEFIDGHKIVNTYGRILDKSTDKQSIDVYFINGILLRNKDCYDFIMALYKSSSMIYSAFIGKYEILIRYLSVDPVFYYDDLRTWVQAVDFNKINIYNGNLQLFSSSNIFIIKDGKRSPKPIYGVYKSFCNPLCADPVPNFKELKKKIEDENNR